MLRFLVLHKLQVIIQPSLQVLKAYSTIDLSPRHSGWVWLEVGGYKHLQLEFSAKSEHVRVRQLVVYGGVEEVQCVSSVPSSQQYSLQVFRYKM